MKLIEIAKFTNNVSELSTFYRTLLNAEPVTESLDMAIFMAGETKIFIHKMYQQGADDLPPENHIAFAVDDVDKTCDDLQKQGLKIEILPKDYYWSRSAYLRDPDGQLIEITKSQT
ncbi:MAG: VOC family protein [Anaerolineales bacterium]|nr:VOC family protein [Anaerolineales bacterium]